MSRTAARVVGVALALVGLVLTGAGSWFAAHLGGTGTATFAAHPSSTAVVVVDPSILNRIDGPVRVTATGAEGSTLWLGLAAPSDASAVLGTAEHLTVTGVSIRDWTAVTESDGSGALVGATTSDVWQQQDSGTRTVAATVRQADAPQSLVVVAETGTIDTVTLSWVHKAWFVQAIVTALVGLALLAGGALLLWPRARGGDDDAGASVRSSRLGVAA